MTKIMDAVMVVGGFVMAMVGAHTGVVELTLIATAVFLMGVISIAYRTWQESKPHTCRVVYIWSFDRISDIDAWELLRLYDTYKQTNQMTVRIQLWALLERVVPEAFMSNVDLLELRPSQYDRWGLELAGCDDED